MVSRASLVVDSMIHGHHVHKAIQDPVDEEELTCERKIGNPHNPLSIAMIKALHEEDSVVGHISCRTSPLLKVQSLELDGFSLAKLCSFAKFAKRFPYQTFRHTIQYWVTILKSCITKILSINLNLYMCYVFLSDESLTT